MSKHPQKFFTLDELVENRYVPQRTKGSLYKALIRKRLLRAENGFHRWGVSGYRPLWVLDQKYLRKLQECFIIE